jgi:hypothetical protein
MDRCSRMVRARIFRSAGLPQKACLGGMPWRASMLRAVSRLLAVRVPGIDADVITRRTSIAQCDDPGVRSGDTAKAQILLVQPGDDGWLR